ncbi:MAG TPA: PTS sugar transporter subunit IIC, partial [Staphylococcus kloosii]
ESAGFGIIGMIGPISAFKLMDADPLMRLLVVFIAFFVVPFIVGFAVNAIYMKVFKLYDREIFKFLA